MLYITLEQADAVLDVVNGYEVTYADYLDNTNQEFTILNAREEQ